MKKKLVFIVNPVSGTRGKERILSLLTQNLDKNKFEFVIEKTRYAGHASKLVSSYVDNGCDAIVAIGGDGTVNEVARSLVHTPVALGIIPCGSGNGLARHLEIPMDPVGAIDVVNRFSIECLDYGMINNLPFFCTCGVGFDAFVSSKFAESDKRGVFTYLESAFLEGMKYKSDKYEIEIEGETSKYEAFLIACANASQYGNNAYIAPHASMSDGLMDVTIMKPFNVLEAPQITFQLFNKTLNTNNHIKTFRCKRIHIHREKEGVIHFDGDPILAGTDLDVQLIEKGLNVIVNSQKVEKYIFGQRFSELCEEFVKKSSTVGRRNLKRIDSLNKEILKKLKG